jgi:hypothetical protein
MKNKIKYLLCILAMGAATPADAGFFGKIFGGIKKAVSAVVKPIVKVAKAVTKPLVKVVKAVVKTAIHIIAPPPPAAQGTAESGIPEYDLSGFDPDTLSVFQEIADQHQMPINEWVYTTQTDPATASRLALESGYEINF